jgi:O-methyltransferase
MRRLQGRNSKNVSRNSRCPCPPRHQTQPIRHLQRKLDIHRKGDFSDTNLETVRGVVGNPERVEFHPGWIPDTFREMSDAQVAFVHVDVDIYRSILDCCEFIYPRLNAGGVMVFDDYGFPTCPGARKAVDEFFANKPETPIVLDTGQAIAIRNAPH